MLPICGLYIAICKLMSMYIPVSYMKFRLLAMCEHAWLCVLCTPVFMHQVHVLLCMWPYISVPVCIPVSMCETV